MNVWDYRTLPMNLLGQISLMYSSLWYMLSAPIMGVAKLLDSRLKIEEA